jgi:hypothetical protein
MLAPLEWFYPSAKAMYMWRMGRAYNRYDRGPVLVLQMGKVGSKSVQAGLEAQILDRPIYHAHFLSRERTARTEKQRRKFFRTDRHSYLMRPWLNQFLLRTFAEHKDKHKWKLITLTREPVGRNISAFFENLEVVPCKTDGEFEISSDYYQIKPTIVSADDTDTLAQLFFDRAQHDSPLRFFDREIKDIFGIDVLGTGFPIEKGYGIYKSDRADLLVLKLESLADCANEALAEFLDINEFAVINRNIGARKVYAPLYDAFKRNAIIDSDYADTLYNSEYMHTFYSDGEIAAARANWLRIGDR